MRSNDREEVIQIAPPCVKHYQKGSLAFQCDRITSFVGAINITNINITNQPANRILGALSATTFERLKPYLERIYLNSGDVLYEAGENITYVYFPVDAIISKTYVVETGSCSDVALIGSEGLVGLPLMMGATATPHSSSVLYPGYVDKMPGSHLKNEFNRHEELMTLLLRYAQSLMTQMSQLAICNRHHSIEQQLRRFLLLSLDRLPTNQIKLTQELISNTLGVRREGITEAVGKLEKSGIIARARGQITVINRPQMEASCCECYGVIKRETLRLQPYLANDSLFK